MAEGNLWRRVAKENLPEDDDPWAREAAHREEDAGGDEDGDEDGDEGGDEGVGGGEEDVRVEAFREGGCLRVDDDDGSPAEKIRRASSRVVLPCAAV